MDVYMPMKIDGEDLYVRSFNMLYMELGGQGITNRTVQKEMARISQSAFDKVVEERGYGSDKMHGINMILHVFYTPECDMWSLGRNIIFSMSNSTRVDDRFYNGHRMIAEAMKKCHETGVFAFPAILFMSKWEWTLYINGKPACHGVPNLLPMIDEKNPTPDDILKSHGEDTPFYLLKNSERAYQCSDIIIKANNQTERMNARHRFMNLMEEARFNLSIPKDRTIVGVLTTYTDAFAATKPDDKSAYEHAINFIVYLLNYGDPEVFSREKLEEIIHATMDKYPDIPEHYVFLDIINDGTMIITYNGDIIAGMSAPEDWYDILLDNDEDEDDDEPEINPYL